MTVSKGFLNAHKLGRKILEKIDYDEGICAFGLVGHKATQHNLGAPCHAALNYMDNNGDIQYMVDAIYPYGGLLTEAQAKTYARYVLMESPYSDMLAEKNIEKGWRRRYFLLNTEADSNILVGGAVALRMLSETPDIPYMWNKLVEAGANKHGAFLVAHMAGFDLEGNMYVSKYSEEGHVAVVPSWFHKEAVKNFIEGNYKEYGKYSERRRYSGFNGMWGDYRGKSKSLSRQVYHEWKEGIKEIGRAGDRKVAIFNHKYNVVENVDDSVNADEGVLLLTTIINDYIEETLNA